jgi:hypothetical protein
MTSVHDDEIFDSTPVSRLEHRHMMRKKYLFYARPWLVCGFVLLALTACAGGAGELQTPSQRNTRTPSSPLVSENTRSATPTPLPLSTPTATAGVDPSATERYWQTVTQDVRVGEVDSLLEEAHETLGNGRIEYFQTDALQVNVNGFNQKKNLMLPINYDVADFAFHSRITWNSDLGSAGCGLLFRVEQADPGRGPFYEFTINRFSGLPYYFIDLNDSYINVKRVGFGYTGFLSDAQASQNEVLFIVKGTEFQIYINHQRSNVLYDATIAKGRFAVEATTVSGSASCKFEDTWIWSWGKH